MFRSLCLAMVVLALVLGGCGTPSLHPLYSPETETADPSVIGTWKGVDDKGPDTYTVSRDGSAYRLTIKNNDPAKPQRIDCEVHLLKLDNYRYADIFPMAKDRKQIDETWGPLFIPAHLILRYEVAGDALKFWNLDLDWMKKSLSDKTPPLAAARFPADNILITADTPAFQRFVKSHADVPGVFRLSTMRRVK